MKYVTLDELYALYFSDLTDLQKSEQFKTTSPERYVVGEGTVKSITPHTSLILVEVTPTSRELVHFFAVYLWFPEKEKEKLLSLKKGQQIKYSGKLNDFPAVTFFLDNCKLL